MKTNISNNEKTTISAASDLAQDIDVSLSSLSDLVNLLYEFSDSERRDLASEKTAAVFLARYPMQDALQIAVSQSIDIISGHVEKLVNMLMELDRQDSASRKEAEA